MKKILFLLTFILLGFSAKSQSPDDLVHNSTSYVDDYADVFTPSQEADLDNYIRRYFDTVQFSVVTIPTVGEYDIDDYAIRLANRWGVGGSSNNGMLILLAINDHLISTQVGKGLEADMTDMDAVSLHSVSKPKFKKGDFYGGTKNLLKAYTDHLSSSAKEIRRVEKIKLDEQIHKAMVNFGWGVIWFIIIGLIIGYSIYLYHEYKRKLAKEAEEMRLLIKNYKDYKVRINGYNSIIKESNILNIAETKILSDMYNSLDLESIGSTPTSKQEFISKNKNLDNISSKMNSIAQVITRKMKKNREIKSNISFILNKDHSIISSSLNLPISNESTRLDQSISKYQQSVNSTIPICNKIIELLNSDDYAKAEKLNIDLTNNISAIKTFESTITIINNDDAKRVYQAKNAHKLIYERCELLKKHCTEPTVSSLVNMYALKGIDDVLNRANPLKTSEYLPNNYTMYNNLMNELEKYTKPYDAAMIRIAKEKVDRENKEREERDRIEEERRKKQREQRYEEERSSYSSYSSSSSSSSSFGGGSFGGGGGSSSF